MKRIVLLLSMCVILGGQVSVAKANAEVGKEVTTRTGLKITVLKAGAGDGAASGDALTMNYTGWLWIEGKKGTEFDSSLKPGREPLPLTLGTGGVIPGWEEGLLGIKAGEKRALLIPSGLAYGPQGRPPVIPASSTLYFEVECVTVAKGSSHKDLTVGEGATAAAGDFATFKFICKDKVTGDVLVDRREKGYRYALGAQMFLPAWDKHVVGMKVGGKRLLNISSREIYGGRGVPGMIEAGKDVVFEVELVKVEAGVVKTILKAGAGSLSAGGDKVFYQLKYLKDSLLAEVVDTRTDKRAGGKPLPVLLPKMTKEMTVFNPMLYLQGMKAGEVLKLDIPWQWGSLLGEPRRITIEIELISIEDKKAAVVAPKANK